MTAVETALLGLQGLLGVAMAGAGGTKLAGATAQVETFERFGYPQWFRLATGVIEVGGALGLLAAFVTSPRFALAGSALVAVVLVGAILSHRSAGDSAADVAPPASLLLVAVVVGLSHAGGLF